MHVTVSLVVIAVMAAGVAFAGEPAPLQATPPMLYVPYQAEIIVADPEEDRKRALLLDWLDRLEDSERVERPAVERVEPGPRFEPLVGSVRPEPLDRPGKVERPEKVERPDKVERPEKIEKVEKVERPERSDRERVERVDRRGKR